MKKRKVTDTSHFWVIDVGNGNFLKFIKTSAFLKVGYADAYFK